MREGGHPCWPRAQLTERGPAGAGERAAAAVHVAARAGEGRRAGPAGRAGTRTQHSTFQRSASRPGSRLGRRAPHGARNRSPATAGSNGPAHGRSPDKGWHPGRLPWCRKLLLPVHSAAQQKGEKSASKLRGKAHKSTYAGQPGSPQAEVGHGVFGMEGGGAVRPAAAPRLAGRARPPAAAAPLLLLLRVARVVRVWRRRPRAGAGGRRGPAGRLGVERRVATEEDGGILRPGPAPPAGGASASAQPLPHLPPFLHSLPRACCWACCTLRTPCTLLRLPPLLFSPTG